MDEKVLEKLVVLERYYPKDNYSNCLPGQFFRAAASPVSYSLPDSIVLALIDGKWCMVPKLPVHMNTGESLTTAELKKLDAARMKHIKLLTETPVKPRKRKRASARGGK